MQGFGSISLPLVRVIDTFVGSANGIRVDVTDTDGKVATGKAGFMFAIVDAYFCGQQPFVHIGTWKNVWGTRSQRSPWSC
jgi:hypothetical protein